jgi:hypothetical protein
VGQGLPQIGEPGAEIVELAVVPVDDIGELVELAGMIVDGGDQLIELAGVLVEPAVVIVKTRQDRVETAIVLVEAAIVPADDPGDFAQQLVDRRDIGAVGLAHSRVTRDIAGSSARH